MNTTLRRLDLDDASLTENTRASYPLSHYPTLCRPRWVAIAQCIFLTAGCLWVMPPIAKLTEEQAMYHFISGYTAKVAGTERGVKEPSAHSVPVSAPLHGSPSFVYAQVARKKIKDHKANCWLVNTGWTGGPYGRVRMKIEFTRALLRAALDGSLEKVPMRTEPVFGFLVPSKCRECLQRSSIREAPGPVRRTMMHRQKLAVLFKANFGAVQGSVVQGRAGSRTSIG